MLEPITLLCTCLTKGFLTGIIGNPFALAIYDTAKAAATNLANAVASATSPQGK
jgi:hypothetical protein